jgi:hypothetical protein
MMKKRRRSDYMPGYIQQLRQEIARREQDRKDAHLEIKGLLQYLENDKFHCGDELDGYVSIKDILPALQRALLSLSSG